MNKRIIVKLPQKLKHITAASLIGARAARCAANSADSGSADDFIHAVELAVSEIFSNSVKHKTASSAQTYVVMELEIAYRALSITIKDCNSAFDFDAKLASSPDIADYPEGGFGLCIVRQIMDAVAFRREKNCNVITMKKSIKGE